MEVFLYLLRVQKFWAGPTNGSMCIRDRGESERMVFSSFFPSTSSGITEKNIHLFINHLNAKH